MNVDKTQILKLAARSGTTVNNINKASLETAETMSLLEMSTDHRLSWKYRNRCYLFLWLEGPHRRAVKCDIKVLRYTESLVKWDRC